MKMTRSTPESESTVLVDLRCDPAAHDELESPIALILVHAGRRRLERSRTVLIEIPSPHHGGMRQVSN